MRIKAARPIYPSAESRRHGISTTERTRTKKKFFSDYQRSCEPYVHVVLRPGWSGPGIWIRRSERGRLEGHIFLSTLKIFLDGSPGEERKPSEAYVGGSGEGEEELDGVKA